MEKRVRRFCALFIVLLLSLVLPVSAAPPAKAPLGINLGGIASYNPQWSFTDAFKMARPWISQCKGCGWDKGGPLDLSPEGWVQSLPPDHWAETILLDGASRPVGEYVILYEGEGTITFGLNSATIISSAPGRMVITITPGNGLYLQVRAVNPDNPIRNIRVIMPGFEATYQTTDRFHPLFLERLKPFDTLRFMDWMETNGSEISTWDQRPKPTDATYSLHGAPVEEMVALANKLNVNPWFTLPHLADDNYVTQFATYVRDNLNPGLKAYIEYSNETWNPQFKQAHYVIEQGLALGLATDSFQAGLFYHSKRAVEMFTIWENVFGGTNRIVRVLAAQSANSWTGVQVMSHNDAYLKADVLAIAPYFGGFLGSESTADEVSTWSVDKVLDESLNEIRGKIREDMTKNINNAQTRNLTVVAYEGGQHLVGVKSANNNDALNALFIGANRHPRMRELYLEYLNQWSELGGGMFAHFVDVSPYTKWGSWGALEYQDQDIATAPKYQALMEYLAVEPGEQIINGGFEVEGAAGRKFAANWVGKNLGKDKRVCNIDGKPPVAHTGECAFRFVGTAGVSTSLKQDVVPVVVTAGDTLALTAWVKANGLVAGRKIIAKMALADSTKGKITLTLTEGTYDYTPFTDSKTLTADVTKLTVSVKVKNVGGKFWVDDMSLKLNSTTIAPLIPLP
jgi:hypothetical protein